MKLEHDPTLNSQLDGHAPAGADGVASLTQIEFFENASVGMHAVGVDGVVQHANRAAHEMLGLRYDEFVGRSIHDFHVNPSVVDHVFERLSRAETAHNVRSQLRCRDGSVRDVLINSSPVFENGRLVRTRCVTIDVTEQKRSDEAVRAGETQFRDLADATPVLIWISGPDQKGVYFNRAWLEFTGATLESQLGDGWLNRVHPDDRKPLQDVCGVGFRDWKRFTTEFRLRTADGNYRWMLNQGAPRFDPSGAFGGFVGSCVDITQRKQAEDRVEALGAKLRERVEELNALLRVLPVGVFVATDSACNSMYMNPAGAEMLGLGEGDNPSKTGPTASTLPFRMVRDGVEVADEELPMQRAARTGEPVLREEMEAVRDDGQVRTLYLYAVPLFDEGGDVRGSVGAFVDITERRAAEQALRDSEARYRQLIALLPVGVYSCEAPSGVIRYYNEHAASLWGRAPEIGDTDERFCGSFRLWNPDGTPRPHDQTPMAAAMRDGCAFRNQEVVIERPDGSRIRVLVNIDPICDEDGRIVGAINAFHDVTALSRAQRDLAESQRRLSTLVSNLPGAAFRWRFNQRWTAEFISDGVQEISGYDAEDFLQGRIHWADLVHAEDLGKLREAIASGIRERRPVQVEYRIRHRDGSLRWVWEQSVGVFEVADEPTAIEGFVVDVTERRRAEEARAYLATIVETSNDAIVSKSLDGVIRSWNDGAERIFGYKADEVIGQSINLIIPQEMWCKEQTILNRLRRGERIEHFDTVRVRKDGRRVNVSLTISPVIDADGRVIGASKIARDISQRKHAENALRRSEERLRIALDAGRMGTWEWMLDSDRVTWSPSLERIHGPEPGEFGGTLDDYRRDIHPDDRSMVEAAIARAAEGPDNLDLEYRIIWPDESVHWLSSSGRVIRNDSGQPVRMAGVCMDITDRKRIEMALRESEERLRAAQEAGDVGTFEWSIQDNRNIWSPSLEALYGLSPGEFGGTVEAWASLVHPDDRHEAEAAVKRALETDEFEGEWRVVLPDGDIRWLSGRGWVYRDENGEPIRLLGVNVDVTQRKKHEERMRIVMAELNHRVKNTLAVVQSLMRQMARRTRSFAEFKTAFEARLRAIADAHSLLTRSDWEGASLQDIITSEIDARVSSLDRRRLSGPPVILPPAPAVAMHMVIHELTTNACKYGAFRTAEGQLDVSWRVNRAATLEFSWTERCSSRVETSAECGFGSQLIEQLIEYELQGELHREFAEDGLRCRLSFPLSSMTSDRPDTHKAQREATTAAGPRVLVVEDNATLAMGLCDELSHGGFSVVGPAATLEKAERLAERDDLDMVVLDVDLNGKTTHALARRLQRRGVPYILLTGYSRADLPDDLRGATVMTKPVNLDDMCAHLRKHHGSRP